MNETEKKLVTGDNSEIMRLALTIEKLAVYIDEHWDKDEPAELADVAVSIKMLAEQIRNLSADLDELTD